MVFFILFPYFRFATPPTSEEKCIWSNVNDLRQVIGAEEVDQAIARYVSIVVDNPADTIPHCQFCLGEIRHGLRFTWWPLELHPSHKRLYVPWIPGTQKETGLSVLSKRYVNYHLGNA